MYMSENLPFRDPSSDSHRHSSKCRQVGGNLASHIHTPSSFGPKKDPLVKRNGARPAAYERTSSGTESLNPAW